MMGDNITVHIIGAGDIDAPKGISLLELSESYAHLTKLPIIIAKVDNELQDLIIRLWYDCTVHFLDITDPNGFRVY